MKTWFTADTHFGHQNIIKFCARPFETVDEMNEGLILRWNETVSPEDEVWHLGDFAFRNKVPAQSFLARLHGVKHLICGNHDHRSTLDAPGWASVHQYREIDIAGQRVVLFHYAMRVWNGSVNGAIHLYGHSHGELPGHGLSLDVGVDADWDWRPVSLQQIRERLNTRIETC